MKTGTCYFPSYGAALRYYRPYIGVVVSDAQIHELRRLVDNKLNAGEIHIWQARAQVGATADYRGQPLSHHRRQLLTTYST